MKKNPARLWLTVLALGWLFDFLFWKNAPGLNFALFSAACVLAAFALLLTEGLRPRPATLSLLAPFVFFAAVTLFRAEPLTVFLAVLFTLLSMALLAVSYLSGRWILYGLADYFISLLRLLASMAFRPLSFLAETRAARSVSSPSARGNLGAVLRGALLALPIVALFASLLASADLVFGQRLESLLAWIRLDNLPELLFRLTYILAAAYALAGVILHAATQSADENINGEAKSLFPPFLGFTEASIVLGSVNLLFAAFVLVQFQYFFGGNVNIHVEGYTYSEYARRGFGELTAAAFLSLLMLLALNAVTTRATETQRKIYSGLGVVLVSLLMVMLFSAFKRLDLYEQAYGFTRLRAYTHVFLVWIGLLFLAVIAMEISRRERRFAFVLLLVCFGFAASLPLLNVDSFIVKQNIRRGILTQAEASDSRVDAQYFIELSDDALPALAAAYQDSTLPVSLREQIGAALICIQHRRAESDGLTWQSFHFSRFRAEATLANLQNELSAYQYRDSQYPDFVETPSGMEFSCATQTIMD